MTKMHCVRAALIAIAVALYCASGVMAQDAELEELRKTFDGQPKLRIERDSDAIRFTVDLFSLFSVDVLGDTAHHVFSSASIMNSKEKWPKGVIRFVTEGETQDRYGTTSKNALMSVRILSTELQKVKNYRVSANLFLDLTTLEYIRPPAYKSAISYCRSNADELRFFCPQLLQKLR